MHEALCDADPASFAELVSEMPGGAQLQDRWEHDPWTVVGIRIGDADRASILGRILATFRPADCDAGTVWVHVPQLAEEMLHWYCDQYSWDPWTVDENGQGWHGGDLAARLAEVTAAVESRFDGLDLDEYPQLTATITAAAERHGLHADDLCSVVCGLIRSGHRLDDTAALVATAAAVCSEPAR